MKRLALVCLLAAACGGDRSGERYGFVARLGSDTISAERVTRVGDTLTSDEVDRFPRVRRRHTRVVLAPDGSIRQLVMDILTPSAAANKDRNRRFTADITGDSLKVTARDSSGTAALAFATNGELTMPHVQQMYSLIDVYIAAALARGAARKVGPDDSVHVTQFYPDADLARFPMHDGFVHALPGGKAELWHDMLSGIGDATLDSARRLTSYDGARSTYKVDVRRVSAWPDVDALAAKLTAEEQKTGPSQLSVRDTMRASIGAAAFTVDYSRPLRRGRTLLGDVIPFGYVWRTGANAATQFSTSAAITVAGVALAPGLYTLWTVPAKDGSADLIVSRQTGQWGTDYDEKPVIGRGAFKTETTASPVEKFTISVTQADAHHGVLVMEWGTFRWTAPIVVR